MTTLAGFETSLATVLDCKASEIAVREDSEKHTIEVGLTGEVLENSMFTQKQIEKIVHSFTPAGVRYDVTVVEE